MKLQNILAVLLILDFVACVAGGQNVTATKTKKKKNKKVKATEKPDISIKTNNTTRSAKTSVTKDLYGKRSEAFCHITEDLINATRASTTCEQIVQIGNHTRYCEQITVGFAPIVPLIYQNETGHVVGVLPDLLNEVFIRRCCLGCGKIVYENRFNQENNLMQQDVNRKMILVPHEMQQDKVVKLHKHNVVRMIKYQNIFFLGKKIQADAGDLVGTLFVSTIKTWPLFVIAISMAICAGTIMWLMDRWINEEHFPKTFPRGPFEGFWWAYVSMTTVGYGDRTPSTIFGRLFAVVWIMIGITIFNMFTATITTVLNSELTYQASFSPYNMKIGVVNKLQVVVSSVVSESATPKGYEDVYKLIEALRKDEVKAIAMDRFMYAWAESRGLLPAHTEVKWRVKLCGEALGLLSKTNDIKKMQDRFNQNSLEVLYKSPEHVKHPAAEEEEHHVVEIFQADKSFVYTMCGVAFLSIFCACVGIFVNEKKWKASREGFRRFSQRWQQRPQEHVRNKDAYVVGNSNVETKSVVMRSTAA